ncbi:hypothetical protein C4D60_Mb05t08580 [Musa balbisiana]|uniref:Auxin-responsive protein n=1 Tax=Musa balbisiana TaxID=52838 RepID=A0A4S8JUP3_MUSBA|nr:hypothetical protein C4D60_Mb05t08580 [Musa balbisiana]
MLEEAIPVVPYDVSAVEDKSDSQPETCREQRAFVPLSPALSEPCSKFPFLVRFTAAVSAVLIPPFIALRIRVGLVQLVLFPELGEFWNFERRCCRGKERVKSFPLFRKRFLLSVSLGTGHCFIRFGHSLSILGPLEKIGMEEGLRGGVCPQLLDLMPNKRDWIVKDDGRGGEMKASQLEVESLELRLGLPASEVEKDPSVLSLALFYKSSKTTTTTNNKNHHCAGSKRGFFGTFESRTEGPQQQKTSGANLKDELHQSQERKAAHEAPENASAANMNSQTRSNHNMSNLSSLSAWHINIRAASVPLVGWPPIRTFRKNFATGSSKPSPEPQSGDLQSKVKLENCKKGLFVKINMEGIPIGRKIDLSTYNSYEKLSLAVEEHFRDLLAAQKDPSTADTLKDGEKQVFTGLLDGTGEYSLIYEDNEGDRMLVGDVPWDMFVSMAKRLRVIKSTDLSVINVQDQYAGKELQQSVELY